MLDQSRNLKDKLKNNYKTIKKIISVINYEIRGHEIL